MKQLLLDRYLEGGARVIDIGCGTGQFTKAIAPRCGEVDAVDINPKRIAELRRSLGEAGIGNVRVHDMDATALGFGPESFDLAVFYRSLDHIADFRAALGEAARVLKPGGILYACAADAADDSPRVRELSALRRLEDELIERLGIAEGSCEVVPIDLAELRSILSAVGFGILEEELEDFTEEQNGRYAGSVRARIESCLGKLGEVAAGRDYEAEYRRLVAKGERVGWALRRTFGLVARKSAEARPHEASSS